MRFRVLMTLVGLFLSGSLAAASIIPRTATKGIYQALYDFTSQDTGEVDLQKGEIVTVLLENASGWWLVEKPDGSAQGWTPGSYLSKLSSGPSSSTKTTSLPSTTNIKSSKSKTSLLSSKKTSESLSSIVIKQTPSSRSSTSTRPSNFSQPSSSSQSSTSVRPSSISSTRTTSVRALGQAFNTAIGTTANSTSSSSSIVMISSVPEIAPTRASTIAFSKSSTTPSIAGPMNVGSSEVYGMVASTRLLNDSSSLPMSTGSPSNPTPASNSTDCLINCETANSSPTPTINSSRCLMDCDITTSAPTSTRNPTDCLMNCASTNLSQVNATSQASSINISSDAVPSECADPGGVNGITTACWIALDMSEYITEWMISHRGVCRAQTSFAQCFLQVLDTGMNDCVSISSGTCPPPSWIQFKDHNRSVREFYVAYNIYAVWTFFNSYYLAIGNARSAATESVAAIVSLIDPPKTNNAELSNINFALLIGLTFVRLEGFAAPVVESLVGVVVNAARQVPQVARYLFPGPPGDTKFVQLGQISNQMGTLTDNLQKNVADALSIIQNDTDTLLSFTGTGAFSNNPVVKMNQQSDSLLTALNTYVISLCLQANNWQISRAIDTDVNQLMANGTKLTWNIPNCGTGYDQNSICGAYYWNKTIDVSYTLTNTDDMFQNPAPIMQQIFANWTTPQLLFDGALQCQMAKGTGSPNISPNAGTSDVASTPCLSSVKICTWDLNPSHFGTRYEYTDCDVQDHFATLGCTQCDASTDFCTNVPSSYLGGYLLNSLADGPQYVYCDDGHTLINTN